MKFGEFMNNVYMETPYIVLTADKKTQIPTAIAFTKFSEAKIISIGQIVKDNVGIIVFTLAVREKEAKGKA